MLRLCWVSILSLNLDWYQPLIFITLKIHIDLEVSTKNISIKFDSETKQKYRHFANTDSFRTVDFLYLKPFLIVNTFSLSSLGLNLAWYRPLIFFLLKIFIDLEVSTKKIVSIKFDFDTKQKCRHFINIDSFRIVKSWYLKTLRLCWLSIISLCQVSISILIGIDCWFFLLLAKGLRHVQPSSGSNRRRIFRGKNIGLVNKNYWAQYSFFNIFLYKTTDIFGKYSLSCLTLLLWRREILITLTA